MRGMMMTKMASGQAFLQASLRPDILDKIEMSVDIHWHFIISCITMNYSFMSSENVDKRGLFSGHIRASDRPQTDIVSSVVLPSAL